MKKRYALLLITALGFILLSSSVHPPQGQATTLGFGSTSQHCLPAASPLCAYTLLCTR